MAREDLLANFLRMMALKEDPPASDENTIVQKMINPYDTAQLSADNPPTIGKYTVAAMIWGGTGFTAGWKWGQGQWK